MTTQIFCHHVLGMYWDHFTDGETKMQREVGLLMDKASQNLGALAPSPLLSQMGSIFLLC